MLVFHAFPVGTFDFPRNKTLLSHVTLVRSLPAPAAVIIKRAVRRYASHDSHAILEAHRRPLLRAETIPIVALTQCLLGQNSTANA